MKNMDSLLNQLREEVIDLRVHGLGLTKQMWLLYVTFEDFVCLCHPKQSKNLLKNSIDINTYIRTPCSIPDINSHKHPAPNHKTQSDKTRFNRPLYTDDKKEDLLKICGANTQSSTQEDKTCFNKHNYKVIVSYQIAKIQRLANSRNKNPNGHKRTRPYLDGVNGVKSMETGGAKQKNRQPDNMHDTSVQGSRNNADNKCVSSVEIDNGQDCVSNFHSISRGPLFRRCVSQDNPTSSRQNDNARCQQYNPQFNSGNLNLESPKPRPQCIRHPVRTGFSSQSNTRAVNVRALQAISDTVANQDPCVTNKLSVQSKCWNQLRVQGILPCENRNSHPTRLNISFDSASHHSDMSPKRLKHGGVSSSSHHNVNERVRNVSAMRTKPNTLSLEHVNHVGTPRKNVEESTHNVSADLSQCHSNDSSPVTISSGYESDSIPTCEAEIDRIFTNHKRNQAEKEADMEPLTDYFSMSDSHPNPETPTKTPVMDSVQSSVSKVVVRRVPEKSNRNNGQSENQPPPKPLKNKLEKSSEATKFSPKDRHNYQLTKVARSMFEIIDDLSAEEKLAETLRKKNRKPRKNTPSNNPNTGSWQNQNNCVANQQNIPPSSLETQPFVDRFSQVVNTSSNKFSVKCLRRPLGQDPSDFDRNSLLPHSNSAVLPSYEDDTPSRRPHTSGPEFFRLNAVNNAATNQTPNQKSRSLPPHSAPPLAYPLGHINQDWTANIKECTPYATTKLPGCQTPRRDPRDDHVYETIPGDEFLYEEMLRLRASGIIPQKFRKIYGFPGAFVPYEPPALPARNDRGNALRRNQGNFPPPFLVMTDANANHSSNIPDTRASFCVSSSTNSNKNNQILIPKCRSRSASWDGYASLDMRRDTPVMTSRSAKCSTSDLLDSSDEFRQNSPSKRRENFYLLLTNRQKRADFSESLEIETKLKGLGLVLGQGRREFTDADGYTTMDGLQSIDFQPEMGPQFLQSTYV